MDKNTSISLHLAKVMGLNGVELLPFGESGSQVAYIDGSGMWLLPFTNRAQWANVVLWFAKGRHTLILQSDLVMADYADIHANPAENNEGSIIAAALECVALATGWAG